MMLRLLLVLAWLTPLAVARMGNVYPLKERRTQDTTELTLDEFINLDLTFSDDSPGKELQTFYLDLLETDGNLPANPSLILVKLSLEDFIWAELGAVYGKNNAIDIVNTTIVSQEAITRSGSADIPTLGSRLETQVNVMFENEPSPEVEEVEELLMQIMQNMTYYVTNLTLWADQDEELNRVHTVTRVEVVRTNPTTPTATGVEEGTTQTVEDDRVKLTVLIPVIAAGIVLFAVIALLATKRRERTIVVAPVGVLTKSQPMNVEVYMDDDNSDNFSFETSLAESPKRNSSILKPQTYGVNSPARSAGNGLADSDDEEALSPKTRGDDESDMFSGIDCQTSPSPRNGGRSVFSFLSAVRGSGSTVGASNTTKANAKRYTPSEVTEARVDAGEDTRSPSNTPKSRASLFSFSDGDESLYGIDEVPSDEETSDRVEEQEASANNASLLVLLSSDSTEFGPRPIASPASPSSVDFSRLLSDNDNSGFVSTTSQSPSVIQPTALENADSSSSAYPNLKCLPEKCLPTCGGDKKAAVSSTEIIAELALGTHAETKVKVLPSAAAFETKKAPSSTKSAGSINSTMATPMIQNTKSSKSQNGGYQSDPGSNTPKRPGSRSGTGSDVIQLDWGDTSKGEALRNAARAAEFVGSIAPLSPASSEEDFDGNGRRHAKSTTADGTSKYQRAAMQPMDWSLTSYDGESVSGSEISETEAAGLAVDQIQDIPGSNKKVWRKGPTREPTSTPTPKIPKSPRSPKAPATPKSLNLSVVSNESAPSASQQLISELVWLEKKISNSSALQPQPQQPESPQPSAPGVVQTDSLSFQSNADSYDSTINLGTPTSQTRRGGMQAIVCRDCFAPPGKLKIVIHSTKDGPAVHTVKKGSSLEGHIFSGDLIISVDNVDTRSYTAEQVMKIMTTKTRFERKITVLHFEDESNMV